MTWKQIESRRETRLWITQVLVPAATLATAVLTIPGAKEAIGNKLSEAKYSIKQKFTKKES